MNNTVITIDQTGTVTGVSQHPLNRKESGLHPDATHRITLFCDCLTKDYPQDEILELAGMQQHSDNVLQYVAMNGNRYFERLSGPRPDGYRYDVDLKLATT